MLFSLVFIFANVETFCEEIYDFMSCLMVMGLNI